MPTAPETHSTDSAQALIRDDEQLRNALPLESVGAAARETTDGLARTVEIIMEGYAERAAVGERSREAATDPATGRTSLRLLPEFTTTTYGELWERTGAVAAELSSPDSRRPVKSGDFIALYGFTSVDYTVLELACIRLGAVYVPLQSSTPTSRLGPILAETDPSVLATSLVVLDSAVELVLASESKPRLVVFDYHPEVDDERERFEGARARLARAGLSSGPDAIDTLTAVTERGRALPAAPLYRPEPHEDPMRLLIYTSGSTGSPKGAIYSDRMLRGLWTGGMTMAQSIPSIGFNYMPLSHVAGRLTIVNTLSRGGTSYFTATSDASTLFEDIALVRPTELILVPRISEMIFHEYRSLSARRAGEFADPDTLAAAVKADLRERFLGGRLMSVMSGSAPISAELKQFIESCLNQPLHDVYASTEAGLVLYDTRVQRPPVIDYKLVDVPELGYYTTDSPHPRGELLVKTQSITRGYYKRPDITAEVFDEHDFYRTGDIMAEIGPDQLVYLDRRNNVQKLAQGEFVTVSRLEALFVSAPLIRQIYVHGNSERSYLLAVVVPTETALRQAANEDELKRSLSESLQSAARQAELESYEIPRDFLIEIEPFSADNGLLTELGKNMRPRLRERYGARLEELYAQLDDGRQEALLALREAGPQQPVLDAIIAAVEAQLGWSASDLSPTARFTDLGVDSLSALTFSALMRDVFQVEVPVGVLLSPANDLRAIATHIETELGSSSKRPSFATVHGIDGTEVRAADLRLEKFIDAATLATARQLPPPAWQNPHTVLLTGANGYLGRFMCLDQLERLAQTGGTLVCLVRGADPAEARRRLDAVFDNGDAELRRRYQDTAKQHLVVLAGDISRERLGLDPKTWNDLAEDVDLILHQGAQVNHVLPYEQLFGPNVLGTAELIRLALTAKLKPVSYLSSVGVALDLDAEQFDAPLDETADIRVVNPSRSLADAYASGYSTSKWAGEVLLREAHEECGLPVTVFRSDMILAHSRYTGQLNMPDRFTRLLLSVALTGIAPDSFYRKDTQGNAQRAHYDGLPVDFVAEAVNTLGARNTAEYLTYNVVNPHDDGVSLDTFVDWLIEAGQPIHRIDNYDDWFTRFETALRALPEAQRRDSALPLLHSYGQPEEPLAGSFIPNPRFQNAVHEAGIGDGGQIPHLSAELIAKYLSDLRYLGRLAV